MLLNWSTFSLHPTKQSQIYCTNILFSRTCHTTEPNWMIRQGSNFLSSPFSNSGRFIQYCTKREITSPSYWERERAPQIMSKVLLLSPFYIHLTLYLKAHLTSVAKSFTFTKIHWANQIHRHYTQPIKFTYTLNIQHWTNRIYLQYRTADHIQLKWSAGACAGGTQVVRCSKGRVPLVLGSWRTPQPLGLRLPIGDDKIGADRYMAHSISILYVEGYEKCHSV